MSMGQCFCGTTIKDSDLVSDTLEGLAYQCPGCGMVICYYNDPCDVLKAKGNSPQQVTPVMRRCEKLKVCPFCGSSKVRFTNDCTFNERGDGYRTTWPKGIYCDHCKTEVIFFDERGWNIGHFDKLNGKQRITSRWNVRTFA